MGTEYPVRLYHFLMMRWWIKKLDYEKIDYHQDRIHGWTLRGPTWKADES